jgi:hypothetical protein
MDKLYKYIDGFMEDLESLNDGELLPRADVLSSIEHIRMLADGAKQRRDELFQKLIATEEALRQMELQKEVDDEYIDHLETRELPPVISSAYDLIADSYRGDVIYNWATKQTLENGSDFTIAMMVLKCCWGKDKIAPRGDVYYKCSPLQFDENGRMEVRLYRDTKKSPRKERSAK